MTSFDAALIGSGIGLSLAAVVICTALACFALLWFLEHMYAKADRHYRELKEDVEAEELLERSL